jgi:hypothetical protein
MKMPAPMPKSTSHRLCLILLMNLSKLVAASKARGVIELSVAYIIPEKPKLSH